MATKFIIYTLLAFCLQATANAQSTGNTVLDSMIERLSYSKEDTNKVLLLNAITNRLSTKQQNEAVKYGENAIALANSLDYRKGKVYAYRHTGAAYFYPLARELAKRSRVYQ